MRTAFETVAVAFSMFSALPMPRVAWKDSNMRYALCAFPLVGLAIGLAQILWAAVCGLGLPPVLRGMGLCLLPVWLTGGIHLHTLLCPDEEAYERTVRELDEAGILFVKN